MYRLTYIFFQAKSFQAKTYIFYPQTGSIIAAKTYFCLQTIFLKTCLLKVFDLSWLELSPISAEINHIAIRGV